MTYDEISEYLEELNNAGIRPGLEAITELCEKLGNPQDSLKFIHIAGTNGKGATGLFIASILKSAGYRVGVYQSPAVFNDKDIISVNGRNISKADYVRLIEKIKNTDVIFTRFELETAMAFLYFKEKQCDFVVLECGMGGLEDATNVVKNTEICVFTAIGMDHSTYLGNTVGEIAENKSGIIKPGSGIIVNGQNDELTIRKLCKPNFASYISNTDSISKLKTNKNGSSFNYKDYKGLEISVLGIHQVYNAITAIEAVKALKERGYVIKDKAVYEGLKNMKEPGRFEIILKKPCFVIDGAHNEPASIILRENIDIYFANKKIIYIMCVLKDKEYGKVIRNTCDKAWQIITVPSPNRVRGLPSYDLAAEISRTNNAVTSADSIEEGVELALMLSDNDTVIICFGSLSHLGKVKKLVENRKDIKKDWHGTNDK